MKSVLCAGIALGVIAGGVWAEPSGPADDRRRPERGENGRPGPGREGDPAMRGDRRGGAIPGEMAARMMQTLDADKDGSIRFEEFIATGKVAELPQDMQRALFHRFDKNKDGAIQRQELPASTGPARSARPGEGFRKLDLNRDGKVSRPEFLKSPRLQNIPPEKRHEIFMRLDRNKDGFVDGRDHHRGPRPEGMPGRGRPSMDPDRLRAELDKNGDGAVSFEEFSAHPRFGAMDEDQREDLFEKMDRNGDQRLDAADGAAGGPREHLRPLQPQKGGPERTRPGRKPGA